jgi:competence protein ComEA
MKSVFKSYFYFSRGEKAGIMLFISIILILFFIPAYMNYKRKPKVADFSQYSREIMAFESALQADSIHNNKRSYVPDFERPDRSVAESRLHPVTFDPNILSAEKWIAMGLSEKQVKIILNYRNKGGKFFQKEDLRKIYGISESEYNILAPFIVISKPAYRNDIEPGKPVGGKFVDFKKTIIELNKADSIDLLEIRGVGPAFAHRILRYRNKLGGFYKKEQLLEVYGMDSSRYMQVSDYCSVQSGAIQKINMNTASVADFKKHPYFDYYLAKSIVDYRIIHGPYSNVEQLRYTPLIYNDLYNRISPYLKTE